MASFVDASDDKDQALGVIDYLAGLLDASAAEQEGENPNASFRADNVALAEENKWYELVTNVLDKSMVLWKYSSAKEIFSCFTIMCAILRRLQPEQRKELGLKMVKIITEAPTEKKKINLKLLSSVFSMVKEGRYEQYIAYLEYCNKVDYGALSSHLQRCQQWIQQWGCDSSQSRNIYLLLHKAFQNTHQEQLAFDSIMCALDTLQASDKDVLMQNCQHAAQAVLEAIALPQVYVYDHLLALDAVNAMKQSQEYARMHQLLDIVSHGSYSDFESFKSTHSDYLSSNKVDVEQLTNKMRLLTLIGIAEGKSSLSYKDIAQHLMLSDEQESEEWVIEAINKELIGGKLDQLGQCVVINGTVKRTFGKHEWGDLANTLQQWLVSVRKINELMKKGNALEQVSVAQ